ncbi:MAG: ATP-binding protein [Geminicoccaceae bacterium]
MPSSSNARWFPSFRRLPALIQQRLSHRGDTEHEQALIRVGIVFFVVVYAFSLRISGIETHWPSLMVVSAITWFCALLLFAHIVWRPAVNPVRRYIGMVLDQGGCVAAMAVGEELTAFIYPLILWTTFGHGFRFGRRNLFAAAVSSWVLFSLLLIFSPYWREMPILGVGLLLGLILLPAYVSRLLHQLHLAIQRAEQSSRAKSQFLATMSHELRTPLTAVIGMGQDLRGTRLDPEQHDMVRVIHTAANALLNLIEDLLDFAKIEAGEHDQAVVAFDFQKLIVRVRDILRHQAMTKGLEFRMAIDPAIPLRVVGPEKDLQQVLINLVGNAIKFTGEGYVSLRADLAEADDGTLRVELSVKDTGIGIPKDAQKHVFEHFAQADASVTRRYGGTGLGLAIAKRMVEDAGGSVALASTPGEGSLFTVRIPLTAAENESEGEETPRGTVRFIGDMPEHMRLAIAGQGWAVIPAGQSWLQIDSGEPTRQVLLILAEPTLEQDLLQMAFSGRDRAARDVVVVGAEPSAAPWALAVLPADPPIDLVVNALRAGLIDANAEGGSSFARVAPMARSLDLLVAEDNKVNQKVIASTLKRGGHRVTLKGDGLEALETLRNGRFDVAIIDVNMPHMGGMEIARAYLRDGDKASLTPLIALTADATTETREACLRAGFDKFLTKPIESFDLLYTLHDIAGGPVELGTAGGAQRPSLPASREAMAGEPEPNRAEILPHPALGASAVVLDQKRLEELRILDDDEGFVRELLDEFLDEGGQLVDEMAEAAAAGDSKRFRDAAHALRSSAAHVGATSLFECCMSWRNINDAKLKKEADVVTARLRSEFERLKRALSDTAMSAAG